MAFKPCEFVIRRPRHAATDDTEGRIWLEVVSEPKSEPQDIQLVDFSRRGAKFELRSPVAPNSEVILHVDQDSLGLSIEIPGRVRWQRCEGVGRLMMGCRFEQLVAYEVIGEMFLSGVLSTNSESS